MHSLDRVNSLAYRIFVPGKGPTTRIASSSICPLELPLQKSSLTKSVVLVKEGTMNDQRCALDEWHYWSAPVAFSTCLRQLSSYFIPNALARLVYNRAQCLPAASGAYKAKLLRVSS